MSTTEENMPSIDVDNLVEEVTNALRPALIEFARTIITSKAQVTKKDETDRSENSVKDIDISEFNRMPAMAEDVRELLEKMSFLIEDDRKFNKMHEELDDHRKGLYRKILSPILKSIVVQYSKVSDLYTFYNGKQMEENVDKAILFSNLLKEYQNLQLSLSDLLYDYDIEIIEPRVGEEFNPKRHKAIKTISTDKPEHDRTISACITIGFKDMQANEQIIKYPEVEILKLNQ